MRTEQVEMDGLRHGDLGGMGCEIELGKMKVKGCRHHGVKEIGNCYFRFCMENSVIVVPSLGMEPDSESDCAYSIGDAILLISDKNHGPLGVGVVTGESYPINNNEALVEVFRPINDITLAMFKSKRKEDKRYYSLEKFSVYPIRIAEINPENRENFCGHQYRRAFCSIATTNCKVIDAMEEMIQKHGLDSQ